MQIARGLVLVPGVFSVILAASPRASAECELWNQSALRLDADGSVLRPYDMVHGEGVVAIKVDEEGKDATPVRVPCYAPMRVTVEAGKPVATALPRSIQVETTYRTGTVKVHGPRGRLTVKIAGLDVAVDATGTATATPDLRAVLLAGPIPTTPDILVYGNAPVTIDATSGRDHLELVWVASGILELGKLANEADAVATTPPAWAAPLGAAPHPGLLVTPRPGSHAWTTAVNGLARLDATQIVARSVKDPETVGQCMYSGFNVPRFRISRLRDVQTVTVFEAKTGKVLATRRFAGGDPPECPERRTTGQGDLKGAEVTPEILTWLATQ